MSSHGVLVTALAFAALWSPVFAVRTFICRRSIGSSEGAHLFGSKRLVAEKMRHFFMSCAIMSIEIMCENKVIEKSRVGDRP